MTALRASGANDPRITGYLAAAIDRLGGTYAAQRDWDAASREYDEALRVLEPLVKAVPDDYELRYLLAETYTGEGTIAAHRAGRASTRDGHLAAWRSASDWYRKSLAIWSTVPHPARTSTGGFEVTVPTEVSNRLARCDRERRSLGDAP